MKQNVINIGWEADSKYTIKTKTVFALTTLQFPNEVEWCDIFEDWQVDEIVEQMELIGFKGINRTSVAMYMGALNGTKVCQRIKLNKSFQKEINAFRKGQGFDTIKF
jgi:hypothetical protein